MIQYLFKVRIKTITANTNGVRAEVPGTITFEDGMSFEDLMEAVNADSLELV